MLPSRPLWEFTAVRDIAFTLAFPIFLWWNDTLLVLILSNACQPTHASIGCHSYLLPPTPYNYQLFRILPAQCSALSASSSRISCSSLLWSRGFSSVEWAWRCRESRGVLVEDEVKSLPSKMAFIAVADAWADIPLLQGLKNWQILWLPFLMLSLCLLVYSLFQSTLSELVSLVQIALTNLFLID